MSHTRKGQWNLLVSLPYVHSHRFIHTLHFRGLISYYQLGSSLFLRAIYLSLLAACRGDWLFGERFSLHRRIPLLNSGIFIYCGLKNSASQAGHPSLPLCILFPVPYNEFHIWRAWVPTSHLSNTSAILSHFWKDSSIFSNPLKISLSDGF